MVQRSNPGPHIYEVCVLTLQPHPSHTLDLVEKIVDHDEEIYMSIDAITYVLPITKSLFLLEPTHITEDMRPISPSRNLVGNDKYKQTHPLVWETRVLPQLGVCLRCKQEWSLV